MYTYKCGELFWPESAIIGFNAPLMDFSNDFHSGNSSHLIACTHLNSPWNNIVYDLQPGSVILPITPEPLIFTGQFLCITYILPQSVVIPLVKYAFLTFAGSCVMAGYTSCCNNSFCGGFPNDCYCDPICTIYGDCCYDFVDICPSKKYTIIVPFLI